MAPTTTEDDLKLLYTFVKVSGVRPRNAEIGKFMGITTGAAAWRFNSLMKRLEKQFGAVGEGDASEVQSSAPPKGGNTSPPKENKRKKAKAGDAEAGPEGGAKEEEQDAGHVNKKAKLTVKEPKDEEA